MVEHCWRNHTALPPCRASMEFPPHKKIWFDDITYAPRGHEKVYDSHNVAVLEEYSRILSRIKMARERAERSNWRGGLSWVEGRLSYFGRFQFPSGFKGGNTSLIVLTRHGTEGEWRGGLKLPAVKYQQWSQSDSLLRIRIKMAKNSHTISFSQLPKGHHSLHIS